MFCFFWILLAVTFCKPQRDLESEILSDGGGSRTKQFFIGLSSPPGSEARRQAGVILESIFNEKLYPSVPSEVDKYTKEGQLRMRRILNLTVEYLKSGTQCTAAQRIRAYRGLGSQNIVIHPKGKEKQGVHLFTNWNSLLMEDIVKGNFANRSPIGVRIFDQLDQAKKGAIENLDWSYFFGMKRLIARTRDPNDFINFNWDNLATTHSIVSTDSPLISLALQPEISNDFGPGFIVADICPERALPLESSFAFGETEIYVPLFILPEEIVRVEGLDCGLEIQNGRSSRDRCFPNPLTDQDPVNKASQGMRNCYINFGHPIEHKPWGARFAVQRRYTAAILPGLRSIFEKENIAQVRSEHSKALERCSPSCTVAQEVLIDARDKLSRPPVPEDEKESHNLLNSSLGDYSNLLKRECPSVK
jgi:hypothetical protein